MRVIYEAVGKCINRRSFFLTPELYSWSLHKTCATEAQARALATKLNKEEKEK